MLAMELGAEYVDIELKVRFACISLYLILACRLSETAVVIVNLTSKTWVTKMELNLMPLKFKTELR
jgi:hypothetical protein